jgi:hypothetical protein
MSRIITHPFEIALLVSLEDIELELRGHPNLPWGEYLLNPRRLRGSDFLMRWSQGAWSEERLMQAVNESEDFFTIPYGPSGTAPDDDPREFELYFERLEKAGLGQIKRPDLVVFRERDKEAVNKVIEKLGGVRELPFTPEDDRDVESLLSKALMAVECENSLWRARRMPDYNATLRPQKRMGGRYGLKKNAVLPTVIVKEEDRTPLKMWQANTRVPIHVWHVFFDEAYGISLDRIEELINNGQIEPTAQTFQAPAGATTKKVIYKIYYHYAYPLGHSVEDPKLVPAYIEDKNGHILPYVKFEGGRLEMSEEAVDVLNRMSEARLAGSSAEHDSSKAMLLSEVVTDDE